MLAYDLYLKNRKYSGEPGFGRNKPIKKVFITRKGNKFNIKFDEKTIDEYGFLMPEFKALQQAWDMPTNRFAGIPFKYGGGTESKPYVIVYGNVTGNEIILNASGKEKRLEKRFKAVKNRETGEVDISPSEDIPFKSCPGPYKINGAELFGEYLKQGIVLAGDKLPRVPTALLEAVAHEFFDKFSTQRIQDNKKYNFELFLLPSSGEITYSSDVAQSGAQSTDAFWNEVTGFSEKTCGKNAKFLSADDSAFTLNLIDKNNRSEFYKQLGIGKESLEKVNIYNNPARIEGLDFYFFDISNPRTEFPDVTRLGFFSRILKNYEVLREGRRSSETLSSLKTLCIQRKQNKMEVLIDCNLTLDQLKQVLRVEILGLRELQNAPPLLFESLFIRKDGKTTIWNDYLLVVRSLLYDLPVERSSLLKIFSKYLTSRRFDYVDQNRKKGGPAAGLDYTRKAEFCMKLFGGNAMETKTADEKFAHAIGQIAGRYVTFKRKAGEKPNSLLDILTYSKYDEAKLQFVLTRVGQGTNLSKGDDAEKQGMSAYIQNVLAGTPTKMNRPNIDYSYFFYRGAFEELGRGD